MRHLARSGLLALLLPALAACSGDCTNTPIVRSAAPGGALEAVLFRRDCGATTGYSTQLSLLKIGEEPRDGGNVFRADADHGAATLGEWGGPWAAIEWLGPDQLLVRHAEKARIFEQQDEVDGIRISYQPAEP